ncbi:MAG: hypothetical protein JWR75_1861 [Devosia sp.]|nr:hypothetical protein [Devosia sp.]
MSAWVYILASQRNGTIYIGATTNLIKRTWEHKNDVVPGFTKDYSVHTLVWFETHSGIYNALQRERTMKHWKRLWKVALIEANNPEWNDLYDEITL